MTSELAGRIARTFLNEMNPSMWNGIGERPESFDTRICTYGLSLESGYQLDISFEYETSDPQEDPQWIHLCELRSQNGELLETLSGYGIDSVLNLTDTIICIAEENNNDN